LLASNGYLCVNQASDGQYQLQAHGRLHGGGPIAGAIAYGATKGLCYIGVIGATLGLSALVGKGGQQKHGDIPRAVKEATLTGTGVGAALVGAGTAGLIESASVGAGGFFTLIPWLP